MRHIDERTIADLTVRIDRTLCVGFGDCVTAAPEAFALDAEDIAIFRAEAERVVRAELVRACEACPVDALSIVDAAGRQLVP
jgi:ferredoxin